MCNDVTRIECREPDGRGRMERTTKAWFESLQLQSDDLWLVSEFEPSSTVACAPLLAALTVPSRRNVILGHGTPELVQLLGSANFEFFWLTVIAFRGNSGPFIFDLDRDYEGDMNQDIWGDTPKMLLEDSWFQYHIWDLASIVLLTRDRDLVASLENCWLACADAG